MPASISAEDRLAIYEVIALYAHINDNHRHNLEVLQQLRLVFAENIIWEGHYGSEVEHLEGLEAVIPRYVQETKIPNYVDHHMDSTVITSVVDGRVRARTHFMVVRDDRTTASGDYLDVFERTDAGWRIVERKIVNRLPRPETLGPADVY